MSLDTQLVDAALTAAREAAALHRGEVGRLDRSEWSEKGTADFVTEVDREAERRIIRHLSARFPEHAFLAEEGTHTEDDANAGEGARADAGTGADASTEAGQGTQGRAHPIRWIIDPLDGTTNWLHDYPEYAVSIAAFDDEGLRVGVVVNSSTGDEFDAIRGGGSRRNGEPIHTSELDDLRLGLIGTGFPFKQRELLPRYLRSLGDVLGHSSGVRRAGAAALDLCALAMGRLDAFWELWLMPWDVAAGALIVLEAGGVFEPLHIVDDPLVRAAGREGARFVRSCSGRVEGGAPGGGAYIAANRHLLPALREVLGAVAPAAETSEA
jgi:myo-inositol-1(or 4)-monophosphatase